MPFQRLDQVVCRLDGERFGSGFGLGFGSGFGSGFGFCNLNPNPNPFLEPEPEPNITRARARTRTLTQCPNNTLTRALRTGERVGGVVRECLPPAAHEATPGDGGASMLRLGAEI